MSIFKPYTEEEKRDRQLHETRKSTPVVMPMDMSQKSIAKLLEFALENLPPVKERKKRK